MRRRSQMRSAAGSQEGVCESQRRARAKRRAYNDDPKAAAAEDFPKRQMIEIHVQMHMCCVSCAALKTTLLEMHKKMTRWALAHMLTRTDVDSC